MGLTSIKSSDLNYAVSVDQSSAEIKAPFLSGNLKASTKQNITDPNFGKPDGHLDEINPSASNFFNGPGNPLDHSRGKYYNTRNRNDSIIPGYSKPRDSWNLDGVQYTGMVSIDAKEAIKEC